MTQQDWHFPVDVTVHTQNIGGPSAGLAMTLGIIDKLSSGRLTGHRIVAATGTIDQNGNVGDVGRRGRRRPSPSSGPGRPSSSCPRSRGTEQARPTRSSTSTR